MALERDDAYLREVYDRLRADLGPEARRRTERVHAYPSRTCSYTLAKERIFVRVRDARGDPYPECVLRHVLLHELGPGGSVRPSVRPPVHPEPPVGHTP